MTPTATLDLGQRLTARKRTCSDWELVVDNFAGAGGASMGIEAALGRAVDLAINHNPLAIKTHMANHPNTKHLIEDIWQVDPVEACGGRPVGLAWFSPDCKHFSRAKGGKPVDKKIRGLAWVVVKWAKLVAPRIIILENVPEFKTWGPLDLNGNPVKERVGETYRRWVGMLVRAGYQVEDRILVAADYGVPTIRKRLFLIARRDGEPIVWPKRTHWPRKEAGPGRPAWRPAAECIDWTLPCPSIFERTRPLAPATMRRIALGLKKFVLDAAEPFIVTCNHAGEGFRGSDLKDPMNTLTGARDAHGLVVPHLNSIGGPARSGKPRSVENPYLTATARNHEALVTAFLNKHYGGVVGTDLHNPVGTVTAVDHHSVTTAFLAGVGGRAGQSNPRTPSDPSATVTAKADTAAVVAYLSKFYGTAIGQDAREPLPTTSAQGFHVAEVRAFLIKYFGTAIGSDLHEPASTLTAKHRLGLVTVSGVDYQIADIGLRMLKPRELLKAQFGKYADDYILVGNQSQQVAGIGNSVCPELAEALVRANVTIRKAVAA